MRNEHDSLPLADRLRLIRIQAFFNNGAGNPFAIIAGGVVFAVFLFESGVQLAPLLAWCLPLCALGGLIFVFERHVGRIGVSAANARKFLAIRVVLGATASAMFGASVFLLPDPADSSTYFFGFIITSTLATVSYMAYATTFLYGLLVNAVTVVPYIVLFFHRYFSTGDAFAAPLAVTACIWQLIVVVKAWRVSRYAVGAISASERLRDEMAERRLVEQALRSSEDQALQLATMLRLMCDNVPDMIWAKDLDNRYTFVNKAFVEKILGSSSTQEPLGKTYQDYLTRERAARPEEPEWHTLGQFSDDIDRHTLSRDEPTVFEESGRVRGKELFLDVHQARFVNAAGEVIGTVGCARDITERKASEAFVQHLAHHDVLTDLPNRLLLTDRLRQALAQARRDRGKLAVLFVDLDRLKPVNDTLGHDVGDILLKEVADRLRSVVTREADTVARLGGDEFVILLSRINREQDAALVAERILQSLSQTFRISRHEIGISACVGISVFPQHGDEVATLLKNADAAMYKAKYAGRNGYRFHEIPAGHDEADRPA